MAVLDATFRGITSWIPASVQNMCQSIWFRAIGNDAIKLLANLAFGMCRVTLLIPGIVPIVLFKVVASAPIKKAFPTVYMAVVRRLRNSQVQLSPVPAAGESTSSGQNVERKGLLRRRPNAGKDAVAPSPKSKDLHISTWASVDEKVCVGMYATPADLQRRSPVVDLHWHWIPWRVAIHSAHRLLPRKDD